MSPDIFLRQTFGDPKEGEAVYDGMIDRGRGGGGGEGYGGSLSFLRKDQSLSRGFICGFLLLLCFFFSCQGGALCPAQGLQLLKRGAVVNTATVDEE